MKLARRSRIWLLFSLEPLLSCWSVRFLLSSSSPRLQEGEFNLWHRWERVHFSLCSLDAVPHCLLRALHHPLSFRRLSHQALRLRQAQLLIRLTGRLITATTCARATWQICLIRSNSL